MLRIWGSSSPFRNFSVSAAEVAASWLCGSRPVWFGPGPDLRLSPDGEVGAKSFILLLPTVSPCSGSQCPETVVICRFPLWSGWSNGSCSGSVHVLIPGLRFAVVVTKLTFSALFLYSFGKNKQQNKEWSFISLVSALPAAIVTSSDAYGQRPRSLATSVRACREECSEVLGV